MKINDVATALINKRARDGLGLRAVAKETGVSPATLSRIEIVGAVACNCNAETLAKLSRYLKQPISIDGR